MSNQDSGNPAAKPPKGKTAARRKARSLAVQALYSWQIAGQPLHEIEAQFRTDNDFSEVDGAYFHEILHGVPRQKSELDSTFEPCLDRPLAGSTRSSWPSCGCPPTSCATASTCPTR